MLGKIRQEVKCGDLINVTIIIVNVNKVELTNTRIDILSDLNIIVESIQIPDDVKLDLTMMNGKVNIRKISMNSINSNDSRIIKFSFRSTGSQVSVIQALINKRIKLTSIKQIL